MKNPNVIVSSDYGPIIINRNDNGVGKQICEVGYFSIDDVELMRQLIAHILVTKGSATFYDIGANVGTHTLAMAKCFGDKLKIRAFEAQRLIYYMLCGSSAINGITNAYLYLNAVSDVAGIDIDVRTPDYGLEQNFGGLELVKPKRTDNQNMSFVGVEKVSTVTIDSFNEQVDFIKLDIEGMEDKALNGGAYTINKYRPMLFIETLKTDMDAVLFFLRENNYKAFERSMDMIAIPSEQNISISNLRQIL